MDGYDVIIHLASRFVPRIREAVDANGDARFQLRTKGSVDKLPVTDFDPVRLYVKDLKVGKRYYRKKDYYGRNKEAPKPIIRIQ